MDGTDQISADETDLLSDAAVTRLRGHPRFRDAVVAFAAGSLAQHERDDMPTRWLHRDLGRSSLYLASVLLDGRPTGLTFADLAQVAMLSGVCSRGRVMAFVQYAQAKGRLVTAADEGPWSRRRLSLTPAFVAPLRERFVASMQATSVVAPEVAEALPRLISDETVRMVATALATLLAVRPELSRNPGGPLRQIFVARDGGMRMLQHFIVRHAPGGARLLESVVISRADLARRYHVSRTHVNRLLAAAEAAGALSPAGGDRVDFSPAFSDEVEAYFAGILQVNRVLAAMVMAAD